MPGEYVLPADDRFVTVDSCEFDLIGGADGKPLAVDNPSGKMIVMTFGGWVGRTDQGCRIQVVARVEDFRRFLVSGHNMLQRNGLEGQDDK